jgi:hypothetical protein
MPFVEIGEHKTWIRISKKYSLITICRELRSEHIWKGKSRAKLYIDNENLLFGIKPSPQHGYKLGAYGRIRCRKLPEGSPDDDVFEAYYDEEKEMLIVDIS